MATAKTPNYTPEQTRQLIAAFKATLTETGERTSESEKVIESFAQMFAKTTRSIVAKLSKEGEYKAKEYKTKQGGTPVKKNDHADAIGAVLRLSDGETDSLTKANKTALDKIWKALATSSPIDPADEADKATKAVKAGMIGMALELDEDEAESLLRAKASVLDKLVIALELNADQTEDQAQP